MILAPCIAALLVCFFVPGAESANLNATPSISLGTSWDSNIFYTASDEQSDYVFRAVPSIILSLEGPTTKAELGGAIVAERYADHDELDSADATKSVDFRLVHTGPRSTIAPYARYVETNDITQRNILAPTVSGTPEPGAPPDATLISGRVNTEEYSGGLRFSYLLSPNTTLGIGGGGLKRDFSENTSGYTSSKTWTGDVFLSHQLTPLFSMGVFINTSYNTYEGQPDSRTYSGGLRGTYRASEYTTLEATGGATYLRQDTGTGDGKNDDWYPNGSISLVYAKLYFQATLRGSYDIAGGGSYGATTKRGTISLALSDRFSESWSWDLSGYYQRNHSTDNIATVEENVDYASGTAGLRYYIVSWASARLSGSIYRQNSDTLPTNDIDRESVLLELILGNTFNLY